MKHLIAVLIAVLLPLQLSWGVAATYCQHETTPQAAGHFGHHGHKHDTVKDTKLAKKDSAGKPLIDLDCSLCHASPSTALPDFDAQTPAQVPTRMPLTLAALRPPSALQRTPDRPQWPRLA